jgi:moderate conductance mechanosensitive channel
MPVMEVPDRGVRGEAAPGGPGRPTTLWSTQRTRSGRITNLSRDWARAGIDIPVPATVDVGRAIEILHRVGDEAHADDELRPLLLDPPSVMGVESMDVDEFRIRMVARTLPGKQFDVGRELRARIAMAFHQAGITLPTTLDTAAPSGDSE